MNRTHIVVVALILALAAIVGGIAATRTAHLGAAASRPSHVSGAAYSAQARRLAKAEAALRRALEQKPPALPKTRLAAPTARAPLGLAASRTVYVRPAPVVRVLHRHPGGEAGDGEHDNGGGDD